jgi:hypothetical protein
VASNISADEKSRARHHLGYLNVAEAATFTLGTPAAVETSFIVESALDKILDSALPLFRMYLCRCDETECQRFSSQPNLQAQQVGDITPGGAAEQKQLIANYDYWRQSLAGILGVPCNPFDKRLDVAPGGVNVRVRG